MNYFYYFFILVVTASGVLAIKSVPTILMKSPVANFDNKLAVESPSIVVAEERELPGLERAALPIAILPIPAVETKNHLPSQDRKVILNVPFTSQAPEGDWSYPWQDTCEEATVLMAAYYWQDKALTLTAAKNELLFLVEYQNDNFGSYHDTDAMLTKQMGENVYNLKIDLVSEPTIEQLKSAIDSGYPIIAPMAGKLLNNPYFTPPGPSYHMVLIRGYDDEAREFVTNDPGSKKGKGWRYPYDTILNALHDWNGLDETIEEGKKQLLIIKGISNEN